METIGKCTRLAAVLVGIAVLAVAGLAAGTAQAQVTPPDLSVCEGVTCQDLPRELCSDGGFKITLTGFTPASTQNSGMATYTYQICSPPQGTCQGGTRAGQLCSDNSFCQADRCRTSGPNAGTCQNSGNLCSSDSDCNQGVTCSRECAVNTFRGLSHFDVTFPQIGGLNSCIASGAEVTGSCSATAGSTVGNFVLGDGSCFDGQTSPGFVAKCDNANLAVGGCITMTLNIAGENTGLGLGAAVVVDKEAPSCTASCLAGPSCDRCDEPPDGEACLTRTIGFWGTHPWITNNYVPVTVCGKSLTCDGTNDGKSDPSCEVGNCNDVMEGLGSIPSELPSNQPYVAMVKQLTAAYLNLNATAALTSNAGRCSSFSHQGMSITQWITFCDDTTPSTGMCNQNKATISSSGCIEALNAFNNSDDTGFAQTPAPFDRPSVDDAGNVSGADPSAFTAAHGKTTPPGKLVIGKNISGGGQCQ